MLPWFGDRTEKLGHPMSSVAEARKLLAELPIADPLKALEELSSWLNSITGTAGFSAKLRINLTLLLDETGQPFHEALLKKYLAAPRLQDFQGVHLWDAMRMFNRELVRAYEASLAACPRGSLIAVPLRRMPPILSARLLRAAAQHMKLELMRYLDVSGATWEWMFRCYSAAEAGHFASTVLTAYPADAIATSPQRELLRALMLYESSPGNLAPDQIEVAFRITARVSGVFDLTITPDAGSEFCIDLAQPHAPKTLDGAIVANPTMRYFSALGALPAIAGIIDQHARGRSREERRFGDEFTPLGKLTVLKHLQVYWDKDHPHRRTARRGISSTIEVAHSFRVISKLVPHFDLSSAAGLTEHEAAALAARSKFSLAPAGEGGYRSEAWTVVDASPAGIGGTIPEGAGAWVKIGSLCGVKAVNADMWWVGVIRRLHSRPRDVAQVGIELLGKRSLAVWLRLLGQGAERMPSWATSSGSFRYSYFPAILLPDAQNSYMDATMLLESGSYAEGKIYEALLGENNQNVELTALLAEGEDYELVKFRWLTA